MLELLSHDLQLRGPREKASIYRDWRGEKSHSIVHTDLLRKTINTSVRIHVKPVKMYWLV